MRATLYYGRKDLGKLNNRKKRIKELLMVAKVSEEDYLESLSWTRTGYTVHLKRDLDEIYINSYDPEWILAWDGNIDKSHTAQTIRKVKVYDYKQKLQLRQKIFRASTDWM